MIIRQAEAQGSGVRAAVVPLSWAAAVKTQRRSSAHSGAGGTGSACWRGGVRGGVWGSCDQQAGDTLEGTVKFFLTFPSKG